MGDQELGQFFLNEDLSEEFIGKVVDNNDPEFAGRCRVRVISQFDGTVDETDDGAFSIPDADIPWANPRGGNVFAGGESKGYGSLSVPKIGTLVKVIFSSGNLYAPEYTCIQDVNKKVIDEIKDSYQNATVLFLDEDEQAKLVYTQAKGFEFFHKDSHIVINPDSSITIEHKDTKSIIELVGTTINITSNSTINITSNSKIQSQSSECIMNRSLCIPFQPKSPCKNIRTPFSCLTFRRLL